MSIQPLRAIILAAGRGERMRPLTDQTPKPLLHVRGKPLIEYHLEALARSGVQDVVINCAWLEEQFPKVLGTGSRFGLRLHYQFEKRDHGGALETAGGIATALPLLADSPNGCFWVVSGDVFLPGFEFNPQHAERFAHRADQAHLWLVANAPHHPKGAFAIDAQGYASANGDPRYTWASVGLFRAALFSGLKPGQACALRPLLDTAISQRQISAKLHTGAWTDVGTVQRLEALNLNA